jgi:hypothetical protein
MSLNILEKINLKEYINPNFDRFNCNNLLLNGTNLLEKQTYTVSTSNIVNLNYATPTSDFYFEELGTYAVRVVGSIDIEASTSTSTFSFEISLPTGITYTSGKKAYGNSYFKRAGATRSAGLSSQPQITISDTLLLEYVRGINLTSSNAGTVYIDLYIEL